MSHSLDSESHPNRDQYDRPDYAGEIYWFFWHSQERLELAL
jgi:hypothetical protein